MIGVILNDLAVQEDFADSIIGYVFRYHLLMTVDGQANLVDGCLKMELGNEFRLISVPCVFHVRMLILSNRRVSMARPSHPAGRLRWAVPTLAISTRSWLRLRGPNHGQSLSAEPHNRRTTIRNCCKPVIVNSARLLIIQGYMGWRQQKARAGRAFRSAGARSAGRVPPPPDEGQAGHAQAKKSKRSRLRD